MASIFPELTTPMVSAVGGIVLLRAGNALGVLVVLSALLTFLGWKYITAE